MPDTRYEAELNAHLDAIYGQMEGVDVGQVLQRLTALLDEFARGQRGAAEGREGRELDQSDVVLITYGDQIREPDQPPLQTLDELLTRYVGDFLTGVHILPFFPYTSDDGFSVVDYLEVDPALGTWVDVDQIAAHFRLMADLVVNHISASSLWFQGFLEGDPHYQDFFIVVDPATDLSMVVRPRTLPLLTPVETASGTRHVWTTFSADQIDLNFASPDVLLAMTRVLLEYVERGAQVIRLDAIAYLWKQVGTRSIHLPETHRVVQLWRTVFDAVAPTTLLITETNVPHAENLSYFGDGTNEAQMVYNFSLPPLTLHAFHTGDARPLQQWASGLSLPSPRTTFFNFLASHDGIGVRPAEGILSSSEIQKLVDLTHAHGGNVSYKNNPDGSASPYELNIVYFDALNDPASDEPLQSQVARFLAAHAILLSLAGVPALYVHSLFGSRGWPEGVEQTGHFRTTNRQKWDRAALEQELDEPGSRRQQVFTGLRKLIRVRAEQPAFHPQSQQQVLALHSSLFSLVRVAPDASSRVICLCNVSNEAQSVVANLNHIGIPPSASLQELLTDQRYTVGGDGLASFEVPPYGVLWLRSGEVGEPS